jgi:hypothetical protein
MRTGYPLKGALIGVDYPVHDSLAWVSVFNNFTNEQTTHRMDVTTSEVASWLDGELIQNAFPRLSVAERELLLTGITLDQWDELFPGGIDND